MNIAVIGTGYVGLVAGTCFADAGNQVICVDKDPKKIALLEDGQIPIYEPGLDEIVRRNVQSKRLRFTGATEEAVKASDIIFFAVGTPSGPDGSPNLEYLRAAAHEVAMAMDGPKILVNKSTAPIGTHAKIEAWVKEKTEHPFDIVVNPEFLKEGSAVDDFLKPDRVVIGTLKKKTYDAMAELYSPFVRQGNPVLWQDPVSAEITKYACNAFLATRISFMNELSNLCDAVDGDIEMVRKGMATDVRIGKHFLYAGVGYGGSCFPKDVKGLLSVANENEVPLRIAQGAEDANENQKSYLLGRLEKLFGTKDFSGKSFGVLGLAFKPNTDDMREAPSLVMINALLERGASVRAHDPIAIEKAKEVLPDHANLSYCENLYQACEGADAMLLITEWNQYRHPDFKKIKSLMKEPVILDGRNIYTPSMIRELGFKYFGVGRSDVTLG